MSGAGLYNEGETVSISASPKGSYTFSRWSDGNSSESRTVTVLTDMTLTAIFEEISNPDIV